MSVNRVILLGNVGKDPELKFTSSGTPLCRFSLATNETFKDRSGEVQHRTEWHSIVAWNKLAEVCGQYLTRGKLVYLEGSIRSGKWEDKSGAARKSFDIVASQMRMLSSSNGNGSRPKAVAPQPAAAVPAEEDNPFRESANTDDEIRF